MLTHSALAALMLLGLATGAPYAPDPMGPARAADSELRDLVERFALDREALERRYPESSGQRIERMRRFLGEWQTRAQALPFEPLGVEGRIDHVLLRGRIDYELRLLDREARWANEAAPLLPFEPELRALEDGRLGVEPLDPARAAADLEALAERIEATRKAVEVGAAKDQTAGAGATESSGELRIQADRWAAFRAQETIAELKTTFAGWHDFYAGYDPMFSWWAEVPYQKVVQRLDAYRAALREKVLGIREGEDDPIVGTPIGREALLADLASERIMYGPEKLLEIADRELAWCTAELERAAGEMGLGRDWRAAIEQVKRLHVEPGRQPELVRDLAREAEAYVEAHDLVTVPPLAKEIWRMEMLSPERQKVSPFFLGGEVIRVSFPTNAMDHADKLMSMRGNNIHFARATVHHELIPGHHLQGFMTARYNAHRRVFSTPFWGEGWALYWEMLLWDRGFPRGPEDKVGMLFWRSHRAARILFSLRFHLGEWTPQQCIDFLVDRIGHERANATAEVRRSFNGTYPPLYQLAYMIGGLQFRALHNELVQSGRMTDRQFHDAILTGGRMPVEMVRARLTSTPPDRDQPAHWAFAD